LNHKKTVRKKKKRKNIFFRTFQKIRKFYYSIFSGSSAPKEFRPYLGPKASDEEIEDHKFENTRANLKKYTRKSQKQKSSLNFSIKKWANKFIPDRASTKKRRHKKKLKRRKARKLRKLQRITFIRNYYPQYKRTAEDRIEPSRENNAEGKDKFRHISYFTYTVNSVASFLTAYLFVYIFYQFAVLIVASNYKLDSILFYYDLAFNDFSPLWNRKNIIIVTFAGPFLSLIFGFLFLRYIAIRPKISKQLKLLSLWIGLHGFNFFLGAFASGVSFDEGFGYVPAWLFLNIFWKILLSMFFLFLLGVVGYYATPKFLDTSYSLSRVSAKVKQKFLIAQVFLPWLVGSFIIFLVKIPSNMPYDVGILITLLFAVIPILFNTKARPTRDFKVEKKPNNFNYLLLLLTVSLLLLYRLGLNNGLHFELFYDFIFTLDITPL